MQVISVGKHHLGPSAGQLLCADPFHGGEGAHRHEPRGLHRPMRCVKASAASLRVWTMGADLEAEHGGYPAFAEPKVQPIQTFRWMSCQNGGLAVLNEAAD